VSILGNALILPAPRNLFLIRDGDTVPEFTRTNRRYSGSAASAKTPTVTYGDGFLTVSDWQGGGTFETVEPFDLTKYSTVHIVLQSCTSGCHICFDTSNSGYWQNAAFRYTPGSQGNVELVRDISDLSGLHYFFIGVSNASTTSTIRIISIWLEP